MFGYLKFPPKSQSVLRQRYRQTYAAICSWQRQVFGVRASVLISYEAVFLYQLAMDSGLVATLSQRTPTCCRLRNDTGNHWNVDQRAADFVTAFALLMARTKLEDDVRDSAGWRTKLARLAWYQPTGQAVDYFQRRVPGLVPTVQQAIERHVVLERANFRGDPKVYSQPSVAAFGTVFGMFADHVLGGTATSYVSGNGRQIRNSFARIGQLIGQGILLSDCVFDHRRDLQNGNFNPIASRQQKRSYQVAAARAFVTAGWEAETMTGSDVISVSGLILRRAFQRIANFKNSTEPEKSFARRPANQLRRRWTALRTGECDIPCDCGGCDGCGGAEDGLCDAIFCIDCGIGNSCGGGEVANNRSTKAAKINLGDIESKTPIGAEATTDCVLNPTGYILLDGIRHPAKTDGQFCEAGCRVKIIDTSSFGFVVQQVDPS